MRRKAKSKMKGKKIKKDPSIEALSTQTKIDLHPALEEFTQFPKLPIELRLKIWKMALPEPRNVYYRLGWMSLPVPTVLKVNREARAEAKMHYHLAPTEGKKQVYIDPARDTVCIFLTLSKSFGKSLVFAFEKENSTAFKFQHVVMALALWMVILHGDGYDAAREKFFRDEVLKKAVLLRSANSWPYWTGDSGLLHMELIDVRDLIRDELLQGSKVV